MTRHCCLTVLPEVPVESLKFRAFVALWRSALLTAERQSYDPILYLVAAVALGPIDSKMPKRSEEDESEWTIRKNDILDLYVEQDRSLSEVIRVMANQGFTRTKPQYERSLKRWRVSKNVRKEEWDFILSRMNQRQRPTTVKVRGITIPQSRLERQKLRHRESTLDHYKSKLNPSPCSQTPPNIEVSTPQPISKVDALQLVVSLEQNYDRKDTEEIVRLKSQRQAHEYQQTAEDVLNHSVDILVKAIVRHKTLSRRFRGIVRRSRDDFDLELLRRVLIATKLDGDWKMFGETLLFDAVKDGNRSPIDVLLNAGVDNMASDGILSPSELAELLLATSPPLGSFENLLHVSMRGALETPNSRM